MNYGLQISITHSTRYSVVSNYVKTYICLEEYWECHLDGTNSQIPQCTCLISHNALFRTGMCTFLFWMVHCGIWDRCTVGFVKLVYFVHFSTCKNRPVVQIPQCITPISHNAPFCSISVTKWCIMVHFIKFVCIHTLKKSIWPPHWKVIFSKSYHSW